MAIRIRTLNKCNKIAATMDAKRYMSKDGAKLVEIIKLLLPEAEGQPGNVCAALVKIGRTHQFDLPRIGPQGETSFLWWLVMEVAK